MHLKNIKTTWGNLQVELVFHPEKGGSIKFTTSYYLPDLPVGDRWQAGPIIELDHKAARELVKFIMKHHKEGVK